MTLRKDLPTEEAPATSLALVQADTWHGLNLHSTSIEAKLLGASTLVPSRCNAQRSLKQVDVVGCCSLGRNMASRMNADPLMVMQSLHIIHGSRGWSDTARFLIATFNACGRFSTIRYEFSEKQDVCTAVTTELATDC